MRLPLPLTSLVLVAALATGCAAEPATGGDTDEPTEAPTLEGALPDGEHFGFLVAVTTDPATVTIDPATWVSDDEEPNGYRIDDPGLEPVDLALAEDAQVQVLRSTGDPATIETIPVEELPAWFATLGQPEETAPFDVVVEDGEVTEMSFVYRP